MTFSTRTMSTKIIFRVTKRNMSVCPQTELVPRKYMSTSKQLNHTCRRQGGQAYRGHLPTPHAPKKFRKKIFSGKYNVKFGHLFNSSYTYFRARMSCPPKLTELLQLWAVTPEAIWKWRGTISGAQRRKNFFFTVPLHFFWCPGHYGKVQGTVTWTEQSLTFQGHAVSKVSSPTDSSDSFI